MKTKITTCGSNWKVTVELESETRGDDLYMEGATQALEIIFGNGPNTADDAEIIIPDPDDEPNVGIILQVYKTEEEREEEKHKYLNTLVVAKNAGLAWMVEQLEKIIPHIKPGTEL